MSKRNMSERAMGGLMLCDKVAMTMMKPNPTTPVKESNPNRSVPVRTNPGSATENVKPEPLKPEPLSPTAKTVIEIANS